MHDYMFFEIANKLSEILYVVSKNTQDQSIIPSMLTTSLGVALGYGGSVLKDYIDRKNKRNTYLECVKWEVFQINEISRDFFLGAQQIISDLESTGIANLKATRKFPVGCIEKYYPEIIDMISGEERKCLAFIQSDVSYIEEFNREMSSQKYRDMVDARWYLLERHQGILDRCGRIYNLSNVYLGKMSPDELKKTNRKETTQRIQEELKSLNRSD